MLVDSGIRPVWVRDRGEVFEANDQTPMGLESLVRGGRGFFVRSVENLHLCAAVLRSLFQSRVRVTFASRLFIRDRQINIHVGEPSIGSKTGLIPVRFRDQPPKGGRAPGMSILRAEGHGQRVF